RRAHRVGTDAEPLVEELGDARVALLTGPRVEVVEAHRWSPGFSRPAGTYAVATSRRRSATFSGVVSEIHAAMPDSDPARYLSLPGARRIEKSCRCSRRSSRPSPTGAWCQPAMYG